MTGEVLKEEQKLLPFENRINILSVAPGIVDTEMQNQIRQSHVEDFPELERFVTYKQKNQLWTPQQVAQIIVDMITNHSSITVTCVDVRTYKNLKQ
jgi:benzil reductase ((S)-benzoin forming)